MALPSCAGPRAKRSRPYLLNRAASGHPVSHADIECFPLLLMAWYLVDASGRRSGRAALLGAAWPLCWLSNPYFGVAGGLIVGCFAVWSAVAALRRDAAREALARVGQIAAAVLLVVVVPIYGLYLTSRGEVELLFTRQKFELLLYGARLDDYVRPPGDSMGWGWVGNPFAFARGRRETRVSRRRDDRSRPRRDRRSYPGFPKRNDTPDAHRGADPAPHRPGRGALQPRKPTDPPRR